ncbi:MAG: hypothetical protein V4709_10365 [Pseudomonadota bacterium]
MLNLASLWIPILLSAVGVFIASSLIHMVFQWHKSEYGKLPDEDALRAAVRKANLAPGQYVMPHCTGGKEMQTADMQRKFDEGPIATLVVRANGMPKMGVTLGQWFVMTLAVAALSAGLACTVLPRGADPYQVFHFFVIVTFMSYAVGSFINGIWMGRRWSAVATDALDSLIYAVITAAVFAWLWPQ